MRKTAFLIVLFPLLSCVGLAQETAPPAGELAMGEGVSLTIYNQDFAVVRVMVYIGSLLYIVGLILTDISYTLVDPRIKFEAK